MCGLLSAWTPCPCEQRWCLLDREQAVGADAAAFGPSTERQATQARGSLVRQRRKVRGGYPSARRVPVGRPEVIDDGSASSSRHLGRALADFRPATSQVTRTYRREGLSYTGYPTNLNCVPLVPAFLPCRLLETVRYICHELAVCRTAVPFVTRSWQGKACRTSTHRSKTKLLAEFPTFRLLLGRLPLPNLRLVSVDDVDHKKSPYATCSTP